MGLWWSLLSLPHQGVGGNFSNFPISLRVKVLGSPDLSFLRFLCLEEMNATITTILHALSPLLVLLVTVVDLILLLRSQISEGLETTILRTCFTII